jgi:hypothetical protein
LTLLETSKRRGQPITIARILSVLWFLAAFTLSRAGWFEQFSSAALFGIGAIISTSGFAIMFWLSQTFRNYTRARGLKELTVLQVFRFFGILALVKAYQGVLPPLFALPTGLGDIVIASTALFVATRLVSARGHAGRGFYEWHIAGLAHLLVSAALAILTSPTPFGLLAGEITSQPMTQFPMSIVPTFIGPFVLVAHLSALVVAKTHSGRPS